MISAWLPASGTLEESRHSYQLWKRAPWWARMLPPWSLSHGRKRRGPSLVKNHKGRWTPDDCGIGWQTRRKDRLHSSSSYMQFLWILIYYFLVMNDGLPRPMLKDNGKTPANRIYARGLKLLWPLHRMTQTKGRTIQGMENLAWIESVTMTRFHSGIRSTT